MPALVIGALLIIATAICLFFVVVLFVQVVAAAWRWKARGAISSQGRPSIAVVIPAHNEAVGISATVQSVISQLRDGDQVLVVADNCTDETAALARSAGAEVIERKDESRRGKGYALDFAVRYLELGPQDVLIVNDADCLPQPGALGRLATVCSQTGRPVQGLYLMQQLGEQDVSTRIGEFAWIVKNKVRRLGYQHLGLPSQLAGTGMAFPWHVIKPAEVATPHLVEDVLLGIQLARARHPPLFEPEAVVTSSFPGDPAAIDAQRIRWEHGHLDVIVSRTPRLVIEALVQGNWPLLALLVDVCVPPIALLSFIVLLSFVCAVALYPTTQMPLPLWLSGMSLVLLIFAVLLAWIEFGQEILSLRDLAYVPLYALRKLGVYGRFVSQRQTDWVRAKREGE